MSTADYTHLQDPANPHDAPLCGQSGRTMSHHEIKRGRINCPHCLVRHSWKPAIVRRHFGPDAERIDTSTGEIV